jgi:hypothetical protein
LAGSGVKIVTDDFALKERGITKLLDGVGATCTREAESANRRGHPNRSQLGSAVPRRQGRQGCAQSADCESSSQEEGCTTEEIRDAEVNILSMRGTAGTTASALAIPPGASSGISYDQVFSGDSSKPGISKAPTRTWQREPGALHRSRGKAQAEFIETGDRQFESVFLQGRV